MAQKSLASLSPLNLDYLVTAFRAAGVQPEMILTVHSSLSSLGQVDGGAETVVQALLETVGENGTLIFPALTYDGSLTLYLRDDPLIDLRHAPITTGAIPRAAAVHPDARRSIHPTHPAIAIGPATDLCFSGSQSGQGPCGTESPFYKAAMAGGYILMLGVTNSTNTTLHCVEEIAAPYMAINEMFDVRMIDDAGHPRTFKVRAYPVGLHRSFDAINDRLIEEHIMTKHQIGDAEAFLINGRQLVESATAWVREEPYLLAAM